jgi:uncharacterized protein YbaP (TraB family)
MRLKLLISWVVLAGFLSSAACAKSSVPAATTNENVTPSTTQASVPHRGTLYRVRHHGNTAYLFGTIHVGKVDASPLEGEAKKALTEANKLVLEIDIDKGPAIQDAIAKYGMYPPGDSVEKHLTPDTLSQLQIALSTYGIPFGTVSQMKPWFISNMLLAYDLMKNGYAPDQGADVTLLAFAKAHKKAFEALETADYQLSLFDSMPAVQQEESLRETMADLASGKATDEGNRLMDAWINGDGAALDGLLREMTEEKTVSAEFLKHVFLDKRNTEMEAKIESILKKNKSTFVGVGWLHLVGEKGLPKLLQQRGYEVKKIY